MVLIFNEFTMCDNNFVIKYKDKNFIPSKYQHLIFENVKNGIGNMLIHASAGAGKTSTIVNIIKLIDNNKKLLFIAFNRDIVKELKKRIGDEPNTDIMTYHSLGFSILKEYHNLSLNCIDEYKYRTYVKHNIKELSSNNPHELGKVKYNTYINNICYLIDYARYNLSQTQKEIYDISQKYGINVINDECEIVYKALKWGSENLSTIDYTDMVWLPNELNISPKKHLYDWILVDESQDTSIMQQKLFLKCFKRGTRFISVGDVFQSINIWCGASEEAMDNLAKLPHTKIFTLPITYRCPKRIVELAQKYSPDIQAKEDAIEGEINYDVKISVPQSGDMVLCRTTAPLIRLYMKYLRMNKKSYIRGKDIGKNLISLINDTKETILNRSLLIDGLFVKLYEKLFNLRDTLMTDSGLDLRDATISPMVLDLYDSIKALDVLSEGLTYSEELINKINDIFLDSDGEGVCLSTIHKAKGLEADNVFILCKSLMPSMLAKKDWEIKTENNLIYVAITRAKKTLNYISEVEFPPQAGYFNPDTTIKELQEIEDRISIFIDNDKKNDFIKNKEINLPIKNNIILGSEREKILPQNNNKKGGLKFKKFL